MEELNVAQPQAQEELQETNNIQANEPIQDTTPETTSEGYKLKVKYNHEEMEIPESEAVTYVQKGLNYDKAIERAKQEAYQEAQQKARDEYIAEQGFEWMGKPIRTEAEYKQALQEQQVYESLQNQNLPDEVINEILEGKRFREQVLTQQQQAEKQAQQQKQYQEFFEYFANENGRSFDVQVDNIPDEVWQEVQKGKTLIDAYRANEVKTLKAKLKEYEAKIQTQQTNTANNSTSTGSVTGNGTTNTDYITAETFNNNKHDRNWIIKNFSKITESRKHWN